MNAKPRTVRLRAYNIGFGDCLLLTVTYASALDGRRERHMLIDFGSRERTDGGPTLRDIAEQIAEHTSGQLDVVVATHRHQDHVSGFGDEHAGEVLDTLNPSVVIRPWTDIPAEQTADHADELDERSLGFIGLLDSMHEAMADVTQFSFDDDAVARRAEKLAELGIKNAKAIALLEQWGSTGRAHYVRAGSDLNLDEMPGVRIQVLGPPTIEQVPRLTSYAKESEEYWLQLAAGSGLTDTMRAPDPTAITHALDTVAEPGGAGAAEHLVRSLSKRRLGQGLEIIEGFDDVLNNTSVILLVTVGARSLLLAGDAQAENWSFTLDSVHQAKRTAQQRTLRRQLEHVDVYKVGHHGSRNATPKRLVRLWAARSRTSSPLVSVLTTKPGVYDKSIEGNVPKGNLVTSLSKLGIVHRTDRLASNEWWFDIEAPTSRDGTFTFTRGPRMTSRAPTPKPRPTG